MAEQTSIEVQINARVDKLGVGLKVAEAKITESAKVMGDAGGAIAGDRFVEQMKSRIIRSIAFGAITNIFGKGILEGIKGIHAGDSGKEIGVVMAQGIVDGAKSIPIVGIVVSILDEAINGMDRIVAAAQAKAAAAVGIYWDVVEKINKDRSSRLQDVVEQTRDVDAGEDQLKVAELKQARLIEKHKKQRDDENKNTQEVVRAAQETQAKQIEALDAEVRKRGESMTKAGSVGARNTPEDIMLFEAAQTARSQAVKTHLEMNIRLEADGAKRVANLRAAQESLELKTAQAGFDKTKKLAQDAAKSAADEKVKLDEKANAVSLANARAMGEGMLDLLEERNKEEAAMRVASEKVIQDQIDALQAPTMIDKQRDEMNRAQSAAQGMIQSGSTALGQFNFAQDGAANLALAVAKEQSKKLDELQKLHDTLKSIRAGVLV